MTTTPATAAPSVPTPPGRAPDPAAANRALIMRFVDEYQTGGDEAVLHEIISPRLVDHTPMAPGTAGGPAEVKAVFDAFRAGLEGFSVEVLHQVADDRIVMTHKVFSGRHTGYLFGMPATGRDVRFAVMDVVHIADGRIVEHWGVVDIPALQEQLRLSA